MAKRARSYPPFSFIFNLIARAAFQPRQGTQQVPVLVDADKLAVTFIGHSSFLIQIGGLNFLVDPVYANWLVVMKRLRKPGVAIKDLPAIDGVLLTHAHMDHLNFPSLRKIIAHTRKLTGKAPAVLVPWEVADLVSELGFSRVESLKWWESVRIGDVDITFTPAQHWGARKLTDSQRGFGGYVLRSGTHSIYHTGDTGYFPGFAEIAERLAPQVALMPIGAYNPDSFRTMHTSPEDALHGFIDLKAATMIPMHFGTFCLSNEPMSEPLPRLLAAAEEAGVSKKMHPLVEGETFVVSEATDHGDAVAGYADSVLLSS